MQKLGVIRQAIPALLQDVKLGLWIPNERKSTKYELLEQGGDIWTEKRVRGRKKTAFSSLANYY